ncbi:MAG: hydantoinase/oxoprolinase family protein [Planctomycetes bacterium]|nr:hydantoinase/oxoprolinase family protein [Planctomycetota bacterium]
MTARIGIDTGGTFTDVVRWSAKGVQVAKVPSTPGDPGIAVLRGLAAVRRRPDEAVDVVHGTTVGLNAVLTGDLARTVFVTNRGFEDLIEIGRQEREDLYAIAPSRPVPPVPRSLRVGVACRRGPGGAVLDPLTAAEVERTVAAVRRLRPAAVAIGFLHSPANARDERTVAAALRRALGDVPITCSADLLPAHGEYERFSAAILNSAIAPVVGGYTRRLAASLGDGRLRLLRSSLGILPPAEAATFPARAMFSGPAGGVLATMQLGARLRTPRVAAFDMGGTSADLCLVEENAAVTDAGTIGGLPLPVPTVPVHTVGCGGGSIAYADAGGALRVGPASAGAVPGPACYGIGGDATVTDAHVALGHLGADTLLDGAFPIDVDAAVRAIERLARRLGMRAAETARGILTVADATMARAILVVTAERAVDPSTVPLVAYGGAGGLHAAGLAARLRMPFAVLPPHAGAFSALGLALAGESAEFARAVGCELDGRGERRLREVAADLGGLARRDLGTRGRVTTTVALRYRGQGAALRLPAGAGLARRFHAEHLRLFGFRADSAIELVGVTVRAATTARAFPAVSTLSATPGADAHSRVRPIGGGRLPVFRRGLRTSFDGPAVIEEATATTLVPAGWRAEETAFGLRLSTGTGGTPRRGSVSRGRLG